MWKYWKGISCWRPSIAKENGWRLCGWGSRPAKSRQARELTTRRVLRCLHHGNTGTSRALVTWKDRGKRDTALNTPSWQNQELWRFQWASDSITAKEIFFVSKNVLKKIVIREGNRRCLWNERNIGCITEKTVRKAAKRAISCKCENRNNCRRFDEGDETYSKAK